MFNPHNALTQIELKSVIIRNPLVVAPETMVMEAIAQMNVERSPYVLVAENGQLLGIFTEQDVVKLLVQQQPFDRLMMREVMVHPVITLREPDFTDLSLAINLLQQHDIRQLPMVDDGDRLVGLVTYESLHQDLYMQRQETVHDISDRQQVELELEQLNQELEAKVQARTYELWKVNSLQSAILDSTDYAIVSTDLNGIIQTFNTGAEQLTGYSVGEVVGVSSLMLFQNHQELIDRAIDLQIELGQETTENKVLWAKAIREIEGEKEWTIICKDDSCFPASISIQPLKDNADLTIGFVGICRDISDRKRAETVLRESQQFLQIVIDSLPLAVFWKDRQSVYLGCNQLFLETVGVQSRSEVIGKTDFDFQMTEAEALKWQVDDLDVMQSGIAQLNIEEKRILPSGKQTYVETNKIPLRDSAGNVSSILGTFQDISVRKQAEAATSQQLRQQKALEVITDSIRKSLNINEIVVIVAQQVKDLLQSDRVIIFRLFPDGKSQIIEEVVSQEFPTLKDMQWEDEVWTQEILEGYWKCNPRIVHDVMDDAFTDYLVDYFIRGQIKSKIVAPILLDLADHESDYWTSPLNGNKLWGVLVVHACAEKRVWEDAEAQLLQQVANTLAIAIQQVSFFEQLEQELGDRKQTQQKLTESNLKLAFSNKELARATQLKDEFLANMSHELRTPLNAILGLTEGLQEQIFGKITNPQIKALETIERSGLHLLELINDILDLAKIESGQIDLELSNTSIKSLCQSSLAFVKQLADKKSIHLATKLPVNLPELNVDERRIRQVLINLLSNAVKFTPEQGKINLEVSLLSMSEADLPVNTQTESTIRGYLRIAVTDTGIGISPEDISKLFQPFIQIDSSLNRQYQGTGLGLALVKRMVELHGGKVTLTSELGFGSCFAFILPYTDTSLLSSVAIAGQVDLTFQSSQSAQKISPLILLAEDNQANIMTISSYLTAKGYRIVLANNGQEAIALAESMQPDLILMDIQMPVMDGLDATKQIRQIPSLANVPIVALTALAVEFDRDRCLAAGASDYLVKPVRLKELTITIQELLAIQYS